MSEHDEQVALFEYLAYKEPAYPVLKWIHAIPNGGKRHKTVAAKMKAEGVKPGVWDIFVPIPKGDKCGLYIEMKYGNNDLTDKQREYLYETIHPAYAYAVCYSWIKACHPIGKYLEIPELEHIE